MGLTHFRNLFFSQRLNNARSSVFLSYFCLTVCSLLSKSDVMLRNMKHDEEMLQERKGILYLDSSSSSL